MGQIVFGGSWILVSECCAEFPRDNIAAVVALDHTETKSALAKHFDIFEVRRLELINGCVFVFDSFAPFITTKAGLVFKSWAFSIRYVEASDAT